MFCCHNVLRKEQSEIAAIFSVSQGDISYRCKRVKERILLWIEIHTMMSESELRDTLYSCGISQQEIKVCLGIYKTTSQSVTAMALGLTQGNVRHIYMRVQKTLKKVGTDTSNKILALLLFLAAKYNSLRSLNAQQRFIRKLL